MIIDNHHLPVLTVSCRGVVCEQCWGRMSPGRQQVSWSCCLSACSLTPPHWSGLPQLRPGVLLQPLLQTGWHCRAQAGVPHHDQGRRGQAEAHRPPEAHLEDLAEDQERGRAQGGAGREPLQVLGLPGGPQCRAAGRARQQGGPAGRVQWVGDNPQQGRHAEPRNIHQHLQQDPGQLLQSQIRQVGENKGAFSLMHSLVPLMCINFVQFITDIAKSFL